jgi:hypothetical protein
MNIDKTIIFTLMILCLVTTIPAALFFRKLPATELLPSEKVFVNFSSAPVAVLAPKQQPAFSGFDCPVKAVTKQPVVITKSLPPTSLVAMKRPSSLPKVSMIYFEDDDNDIKKAIIDGYILQIGSTFDSNTVVKIEKTRVQIRSVGKDIWLNMP